MRIKSVMALAVFVIAPVLAQMPAKYAGDRDQLTMVLMRTATEPQPFLGSDGMVHLVYEVAVTSARTETVHIDSFEVLDAATGRVLWSTSGADVKEWFQLIDRTRTNTLQGSQSGEFWLEVKVKPDSVPKRLLHRITTTSKEKGFTAANPVNDKLEQKVLTAAAADVSTKPLLVLGPPLEGKSWLALNGCCAQGHRRAGIPINGSFFAAQALAIDWMQRNADGYLAVGDPNKNEDYVCYGKQVIAVADATVASVLEGLPDRVPGGLPPDTNLQNITGNHVILDLGGGRYAFYAHLKPGSIRVKLGEHVRRGQVLAQLGNSGNTTAPHLHFHVMDALSPLGANFVPYVIDKFALAGMLDTFEPDPNQNPMGMKIPMKTVGAGWREHQAPLQNDVVDFPEK